jgi:hypothetical protein
LLSKLRKSGIIWADGDGSRWVAANTSANDSPHEQVSARVGFFVDIEARKNGERLSAVRIGELEMKLATLKKAN